MYLPSFIKINLQTSKPFSVMVALETRGTSFYEIYTNLIKWLSMISKLKPISNIIIRIITQFVQKRLRKGCMDISALYFMVF